MQSFSSRIWTRVAMSISYDDNHYTTGINDSFIFKNQILNISINPNDSFFHSFDIVSLYTYVPLDEMIAICTDTLYRSHLDSPPVQQSVFLKLIQIATECVQFNFNNTMYEHTDGISRESPLRAILVNIFLEFQEASLFEILNMQLFYKWYVDDTFMIFSSRLESRRFFHTANQLHWCSPVNLS